MLLPTIIETYHVDLGHGVDEDDGEDGDGEAEEEGAGEIPDDAPQSDRQEEHQDHLQASKGFGKKNLAVQNGVWIKMHLRMRLMRMMLTAIQMKAVRKSKSRMVVRGNTSA